MNEQDLVELIARQVRARLMAGGEGPGFTRNPGPPGRSVSSASPPQGALCCSKDGDCEACGMGTSQRPFDAQLLRSTGAARFGAKACQAHTVPKDLAGVIDHTMLKPEATREQLKQLAEEARQYRFATVCVNSVNVRMMKQFLAGSGVPVCAVVGFPLGAMSPRSKAFETTEAVRCGASEIDMVINIGALKSQDYGLVLEDIRAVVEAAKPHAVKVILETNKLTEEEKVIACSLSKMANAAFVKTSTGFGGGGATVEDIALMRRVVGCEMGVKASGGVRDAAGARAMLEAGATRIGASASVEIVTNKRGSSSY